MGNHDAGVASAVLNTSQQIGGSIGVAFLNTIAASATTAYVVTNNVGPDTPGTLDALVAGFDTTFIWSTVDPRRRGPDLGVPRADEQGTTWPQDDAAPRSHSTSSEEQRAAPRRSSGGRFLLCRLRGCRTSA